MSTKTRVLLTDDLDGTEAAETVRFGLDGQGYEMELNAKHADKLRTGLAKYIAAARPAAVNGHQPKRGGKSQRGARPERYTAAAVDASVERARIRAWSLTDAWSGEPASDRGRLSAALIDAYRKRNQ